jgi:tetratricopeptide (TPR) repeat protein
MAEEKYDRSRETALLIDQALQAAQRAGHPHLEAEARRRSAWHDKRDTIIEVEAGLEAAEAAGDLLARAGLLRARGHAHVLRGRFDEGARDATEAANLFKDLGHRYRYLKTLQHMTAICEWELGRPGRALAIWRELLEALPGLGRFREAALSAVLIAEMACDLGQAEEAARTLDQARRLVEQVGRQHGLNFDVAEGLLLRLRGQTDAAVATFERARQWGREARFLDFMFQPGILAARLLLEHAADDAALESARRILNEMLEDPSVDEENRNRYAGELYSLYALYNLERKAPEEAQLWLEKADLWFAGRPTHREALEWRAIRLLADWVTAENISQGASAAPAAKGKVAHGLLQKAKGLRTKVERGVEPQVLKPLEQMAGTFANPDEGRAFIEHHPARRLLVRRGVPVPAAG